MRAIWMAECECAKLSDVFLHRSLHLCILFFDRVLAVTERLAFEVIHAVEAAMPLIIQHELLSTIGPRRMLALPPGGRVVPSIGTRGVARPHAREDAIDATRWNLRLWGTIKKRDFAGDVGRRQARVPCSADRSSTNARPPDSTRDRIRLKPCGEPRVQLSARAPLKVLVLRRPIAHDEGMHRGQ